MNGSEVFGFPPQEDSAFTKARASYCQSGGQSGAAVTASMLKGEDVAYELQKRNSDVDVQLWGCKFKETRFAKVQT